MPFVLKKKIKIAGVLTHDRSKSLDVTFLEHWVKLGKEGLEVRLSGMKTWLCRGCLQDGDKLQGTEVQPLDYVLNALMAQKQKFPLHLVINAHFIIFSTPWQPNIWMVFYSLLKKLNFYSMNTQGI